MEAVADGTRARGGGLDVVGLGGLIAPAGDCDRLGYEARTLREASE